MRYGAILAGGLGKRIERHSLPKQFIQVGGTPIIVFTMRRFFESPFIDIVYVAIHKDWFDYALKLFKDYFSNEQLERVRVVVGGKERLDSFISIMNDIIARDGMHSEDVLICHDSVRPFVSLSMIEDCVLMTEQYGFALTVIPVTDTIHVTKSDPDFIDDALDRRNLYSGQTPSGFNLVLLYDTIRNCSEQEKANITGTTQLMLKAGFRIKTVKGDTGNFKITTDKDLDVAERVIRMKKTSRDIQLLDCTLRDGGIVIDFSFGEDRMSSIKRCLESSGVEYIECGYINETKGSQEGRTCFADEQCLKHTFLSTGKRAGITYLAMIDYGTFDLNNLHQASPDGIDGIRFAFHKENCQDALKQASIILQKGYKLFLQPMVSTRYNAEEFRELILYCNDYLAEASAFYIVDSFGQMDNLMLSQKLEIADEYVSDRMKIGFHAHNNRQMAYSNAKTFVQYPCRHSLILDSSIMGMGKGAGNLCTELIMSELMATGKDYNTLGIYSEINSFFAQQQRITPWGYNLDYYLSSLFGCTPSYINIFNKDSRITTDILIDLLSKIPEDKKAACDRSFANGFLKDYFGDY